jgi:hypothetical protein
MSHPAPEELARIALADLDDLDDSDRTHLDECAACRAELDGLRETVTLAGSLGPQDRLESPPGHLWDAVATELGLAGAGPVAGPVDEVAARRSGGEPQRRRTSVLLAVAAGVVGLLVGVLGTVLVVADGSNDPATVAAADLGALEGFRGAGTARLLDTEDGPAIELVTQRLPAPTGYYEAWLINSDGERMISLGALDAAGRGTFQIPADLVEEGYVIVDVSLEEKDGDPTHSRVSVVRGTLPS